MPENALELHPQALEDALAGYSWYLEHDEIAADRFLAELERAIQLILAGRSAGQSICTVRGASC